MPAIACLGFKVFFVTGGAGKSELELDDLVAPARVDLRIVVALISGFPSFFLRAFQGFNFEIALILLGNSVNMDSQHIELPIRQYIM